MKMFLTKRRIVLAVEVIKGILIGGILGAAGFVLQNSLNQGAFTNLKEGFIIGSLGIGLFIGILLAERKNKKIS